MNTETETKYGELSRLPQRITESQAKDWQEYAQALRDYVHEGQIETFQIKKVSARGDKVLQRGGLVKRPITEEEGKALLEEAKRADYFAKVILEQL